MDDTIEVTRVELNYIPKLTRFSIDLSTLPSDANLDEFIVKSLRKFTGASAVLYSKYVGESKTLTPWQVELDSVLLDKIVKVLGKNIRKIASPVSDSDYETIVKEVVKKYDNLTSASLGEIPIATSYLVSSLLMVNRYIGLSFLTEGRLMGTALLAMNSKVPDTPLIVLENMAYMIAVSLRRKHAEEMLQKVEKQQTFILDSLPVAFYSSPVNPDYDTSWVSNEIYKLTGFTNAEFCSSPDFWRDHIHPEDKEGVLKAFNNFNTRQENILEYRMKCKNGSYRWFYDRPVLCSVNGNSEYIGVIVDIDDRKKAEEDFKRSEQQWRQLIELAPDAFFQGDERGNFIKVNNSAIQLTGYSQSELLKMNIVDIFPPDELLHKPLLFSNLDDGETIKAERNILCKDGRNFIVEMNSKKMPDGTYQSFVRNITDRKKAESIIISKNAELETINREKDKLFSIIAHDLKSPLSSFLGLTGLMAEKLPTFTMDEIQNIAVKMRNSAANLYGLLENLLDWARLNQGLMSMNPVEIELNASVNEILLMFQEPARNKSLQITNSISPSITLTADRNMLHLTIRNLISNAIKFTPKDGKIMISANPGQDDSLEISVSDTGIGMNSQTLENLFTIKTLSGRRGTAGEPSTGLGLNLCREFVSRHNGRIWVSSKENEGSVFTFAIPSEL